MSFIDDFVRGILGEDDDQYGYRDEHTNTKSRSDYVYDFVNNLTLGIPDLLGGALNLWETSDEKLADVTSEAEAALTKYYEAAAEAMAAQISEYQKQTEAYLDNLDKQMAQLKLQSDIQNAKDKVSQIKSSIANSIRSEISSQINKMNSEVRRLLSESDSINEFINSLNNSQVGRSSFSRAKQAMDALLVEQNELKRKVLKQSDTIQSKIDDYSSKADDLINQVTDADTSKSLEAISKAEDLIGQAIDKTPIKKAEATVSTLINGGTQE